MFASPKLAAPALLSVLVAGSLLGCGKQHARSAHDAPKADPVVPEKPPTQAPPEKKRKKRDAQHGAALAEMQQARFGTRSDRDDQARFPLPNTKGWTRVRFSMIDHFTGFRYGDDHHSLTVAFIVELPEGANPTSAACVERFEAESRPKVAELGGHVSEQATVMRKWRGKPLVVRTARGEIDIFFSHYDVAMAWAGYPAYPGVCMIYAVVIPLRQNEEEAFALRDKWIDAFHKFRPLTETTPYRH